MAPFALLVALGLLLLAFVVPFAYFGIRMIVDPKRAAAYFRAHPLIWTESQKRRLQVHTPRGARIAGIGWLALAVLIGTGSGSLLIQAFMR